MRGLAGRHALVTGGGSGIGAAAARRLAEEGAQVTVTSRTEARARAVAEEIGARARRLDVTDVAEVRAVGAAVGPVDVLVNAAGGGSGDLTEPFLATDEDRWQEWLRLDLLGVVAVTQAVLPGMLDRGGGAIVNVSSEAGRLGSRSMALYATAKAGVLGFTRAIAREGAGHGVRCNAVAPGPVDTPLLDRLAAGDPAYVGRIAASVPLGRVGRPEDVAAAIAFLASDDAAYVTGQTLAVSGGMSML